jgi:hypothetical protein
MKIQTTMSIERDGVEIEVRLVGTVTRYRPATRYRDNGDPGDPAEGGDVEVVEALGPDGKDVELTDDECLNAQEAIMEESCDDS